MILITYKLPTASGYWRETTIAVDSPETAEKTCKDIEHLGYILVNVTDDREGNT